MSAASTQALVLDFGGVISRTLFETHDLSEAALGLPPGTLTWRGPFAPETDALWQAMQADHITEREYWMARTQSVGRLVGEDWNDMQTFVQRARGGGCGGGHPARSGCRRAPGQGRRLQAGRAVQRARPVLRCKLS